MQYTQPICRNSQFNTKDPYITSATSAIQTKKEHSAKFIIPFRVYSQRTFKDESHTQQRILSLALAQASFNLRESNLPMLNIMQANYL